MKSKLIIFDLDDTLIDTSGSTIPVKLKLALKAMLNAGLNVNDFKGAYVRLLEFNESSLNGAEALEKLLSELNANMSLLEIGTKAYYGKSEEELKVLPLDGALKVLDILGLDQKLILVSFGESEEQLNKMKIAGISSSLFSEVFFVNDYNKKEVYQKIMTKHDLDPKSIVVIGDKVQGDLFPAKELGLVTAHMCWGRGKLFKPKEGEVDYSINNLNKLSNDFT